VLTGIELYYWNFIFSQIDFIELSTGIRIIDEQYDAPLHFNLN
jgi:hypothetical protein